MHKFQPIYMDADQQELLVGWTPPWPVVGLASYLDGSMHKWWGAADAANSF